MENLIEMDGLYRGTPILENLHVGIYPLVNVYIAIEHGHRSS